MNPPRYKNFIYFSPKWLGPGKIIILDKRTGKKSTKKLVPIKIMIKKVKWHPVFGDVSELKKFFFRALNKTKPKSLY